ncbi:MAG: peptidoglycan D,D-transpeptidase FtsI family protein [Clostridiaceae bacterium]
MKDLSKPIKKVLVVYLMFFVILFSYIGYLEIFKADDLVNSQYNQRLWDRRDEVIRGTIYDRDMTVLSSSSLKDGEQIRVYNGGEACAQFLGYLDKNYGITGLESVYDKELSTKDLDLLDGVSSVFGEDYEMPKGYNIVSTIDFELQTYIYNLMKTYNGAVVVINPSTGEVLASVSTPSYDTNTMKEDWDSLADSPYSPLFDRASSGLYPPGSTFKMITAISSLENIDGIEDKVFNDNGKLVFNENESLSNYNGRAYGDIDIETAFTKSSNVVFGSLGIELGNEKLKNTAEKFYFNEEIPSRDIEITKSQFPTLKKDEKGNIAQSAIGQGEVLATPYEMAFIAATIANGGKAMEIHGVKEILKSDNSIYKSVKNKEDKDIIDKEVSDKLTVYMRSVVENGTGQNANIQGLDVCGKTGTSDTSINGKDIMDSWFAGFSKTGKTNIALAVVIEDAKDNGENAAYIAGKIFNYSSSIDLD